MKRFLRKILSFLAGLFTNLNEWIYDHVQPSIETVNRLKAVLESPGANLLVALIPGDADDKLKNMATNLLAKAIDVMHITDEIVREPDWTSKIAKTLAYIKTLSKPMQKGIWKQLASELSKQSGFSKQMAEYADKVAEAIKNGTDPNEIPEPKLEVKGHAVDTLVQTQYSKMKEGIDESQLSATDPFQKYGAAATA